MIKMSGRAQWETQFTQHSECWREVLYSFRGDVMGGRENSSGSFWPLKWHNWLLPSFWSNLCFSFLLAVPKGEALQKQIHFGDNLLKCEGFVALPPLGTYPRINTKKKQLSSALGIRERKTFWFPGLNQSYATRKGYLVDYPHFGLSLHFSCLHSLPSLLQNASHLLAETST